MKNWLKFLAITLSLLAVAMCFGPKVRAQSTASTIYINCVNYSCSPDIGVGINAAIAALPSGGTVVLPSTGTYSMGTGVTIPGGVWVKGNLGAKIQPASNIGLFTIQPDARISGVWVDTANLTANTLSSSIFTLTGGTYKDGQQTIVEDNKVTAENQLT